MLGQQTMNQQLRQKIDGINISHATFYISMKEAKEAVKKGQPVKATEGGKLVLDTTAPNVSTRTFHT